MPPKKGQIIKKEYEKMNKNKSELYLKVPKQIIFFDKNDGSECLKSAYDISVVPMLF